MADRVPPALDAAWQALIDDLHAELDQGHMHVQRLIDRHAGAIEHAARQPAPGAVGLREAVLALACECADHADCGDCHDDNGNLTDSVDTSAVLDALAAPAPDEQGGSR